MAITIRLPLPVFGFAAAALLLAAPAARAQEASGPYNPALAGRGKSLFSSKGCNGCHSIGKGRMAGPDLLGVTDRRTPEWLKKFIKDPPAMFGSDSTAAALVAEAKGAKMPNLHLQDSDIEALLSYFAQETAAKKK
ncbi:MAG TPA: cytochrome c [Gemmatimonadales bacterium]|nr:cytochrome c [Gemmatimonadales bacterium]